MKNIKNILYTFFALFLLNSCEKWLDVNTNPNDPATANPENVLPAAQTSIFAIIGGDIAVLGGLWSQHWTQSNVASQYKSIDGYALNPNEFDFVWNEMYAGGLNDFETLKKQGLASGNHNLALQSVAVQSFGFQILADFFDKIPLSQAFQFEKYKSPVYDDGPKVYAELIKRLDAALALDFNNLESKKQIKSDLVFGDLKGTEQIEQWKKFANTLKLKLYLRQTSSENKSIAISEIKKMLNAGTQFLTKSASVTKFIDEANRSNPLFENSVRQLNVATNLRMSNTLYSYLQKNDDSLRLGAYFIKGNAGHFGLIQGDFEAPTTKIPGAKPSTVNLSATDPFYFFSMDQVNFMLAEAYLLTGNNAKSQEFYEKGVKAGYEKFGIPFNTAYITQGAQYAYPTQGSEEDKLKAIITQKWVTGFKQGYETFFDQSKTGYPAYSTVKVSAATYKDGVWTDAANYIPGEWTFSVNGSTLFGEFPKRVLYTSVSKDVNVNTPKGEKVTEKVWWMK